MARPLRVEYPHAVYHITSRGNEKKAIFKDDQDRQSFLKILHRVHERYNWICYAYCLMDNHYHLAIETPDGNVAIGMRQLNGVYTQAFNRRHRRNGHLFEGRYKAILVQKDSHLLEVCRYIVLNPVRAGTVEEPADWRWSSYRAMVGRRASEPFLQRAWLLRQFSEDREKAEKGYRQYVREGIGQGSIWGAVKGQAILGEEGFVQGLIGHLKKSKDVVEIPKSQRFVGRPELGRIFKEEVIRDRERRDKKVEEAVERYGYTQREVADYLGLHFTSVSRLLAQRRAMQRK